MNYRIMLVDDERNVLKALERVLAAPDRTLEGFTEPLEALKRAHTATFDLVLTDYRMPGMDGVELLTEFKVLQPDAMRLVLSAYGDLRSILAAINEAQIYRYITKPWEDGDLRHAVEKALAYRAMQVENRRLAEQVRSQQSRLARHEAALRQLEEENPELARVAWEADGSIWLEEPPE